jgi:hypothetical protein
VSPYITFSLFTSLSLSFVNNTFALLKVCPEISLKIFMKTSREPKVICS